MGISTEVIHGKEANYTLLTRGEEHQVPLGYKRTEVGVIPDDWEVSSLEEYTSFISYGFTNPMPTSEIGIYMITARDIVDGRINFDTARCTTAEAYRTLLTNKSRPKQGDLLLTKDGTLGRLALVDQTTVCINQSVAVLRLNSKAVPDFLKKVLEAPTYQKRMLEDAGGSTIKHIYITIVNRMPVALPRTRAEQHAIAETLSDVDGLLRALGALITKKRATKQSAMQQLLTGKTRLRGFAGEWQRITLGDLFDFKNGLNKAKEFFGHGTPIVNYMDVFANSALTSSELAGRVRLSKQEIENFNVRKGDVFFTRTSETTDEIGIAAVMLDQPTDTVFSGFILRARPKNQSMCDEFKAYCFASQCVRSQIISTASYTTRALTNGKLLSYVSLMLPPKEEQAAIATVLSDMDAEIVALERRRDKTRAIKQGMMQQLLTGRVRLVKPEAVEAGA